MLQKLHTLHPRKEIFVPNRNSMFPSVVATPFTTGICKGKKVQRVQAYKGTNKRCVEE